MCATASRRSTRKSPTGCAASSKPVVLVANKGDTEKLEQHDRRVLPARLRRAAVRSAPSRSAARTSCSTRSSRNCRRTPAKLPPEDVALKLAIVGRRNAGKSTFINSLAEAERVIVSEVPGTTRDSVDVRFERDGKTFIAIDTAGVRKKSSSPATSSSTAWTGPSARSAGPTSCCSSSTPAIASAGWTSNLPSTSSRSTSRRSSWSTSGTW